MSQHTLGPWAIFQNSICTDDGTANEIATVTRHGVWMGDGSPYGAHNPVGDANARLIAAAPDMLETLRECDAMLASGESDPASMAELLAGIARKISTILARIEGTTA